MGCDIDLLFSSLNLRSQVRHDLLSSELLICKACSALLDYGRPFQRTCTATGSDTGLVCVVTQDEFNRSKWSPVKQTGDVIG